MLVCDSLDCTDSVRVVSRSPEAVLMPHISAHTYICFVFDGSGFARSCMPDWTENKNVVVDAAHFAACVLCPFWSDRSGFIRSCQLE